MALADYLLIYYYLLFFLLSRTLRLLLEYRTAAEVPGIRHWGPGQAPTLC